MSGRVMYEVINDSRTREEMRHLLMDKVGVCIADPLMQTDHYVLQIQIQKKI